MIAVPESTRGVDESTPVIEASGLRRSVSLPGGRQLEILRDVDLTVRAGESVAIVGRSGSGKTTLLATLGLLTPVAGGTLRLAGTDVTKIGDRRRAQLRNARVGFVFQSYSLVRHLSAAGNVGLPLGYGAPVRRARRRRRVGAALTLVGLGDRRRSRPRHFSGGEQQRVAIAQALVREPAIILADEPTGALDIDTAGDVLETLLTACRTRGCALVVVTHDRQVAKMMSRTVVLADGVLQDGA